MEAATTHPEPPRRYQLRRGTTVLGTLTATDFDFPRVFCRWEPKPEYASVQPYFERLWNASERMSGGTGRDEWDRVRLELWSLRLTLVDADPAMPGVLLLGEILLYINATEANFRASSKPTVRSGASWFSKLFWRLGFRRRAFGRHLRDAWIKLTGP